MLIDNRKGNVLSLALVLAITLACGSSADNEGSVSDPQISSGHPSREPSMSIAPPPAGSGGGDSGLIWTTPPAWVEEAPSSKMRRAQYRIPGDGGDAECVVFYFGPGQGGDARANATRWASQFEQPDGRPSSEVMKTQTVDVNGLSVLLMEVTGTYSTGPMVSPTVPGKPDHMLLGAIAEGPDANWFFKLTGPQVTVRSNQEAFQSMIQSLKPGS